ncbi:MAG: hypothetical protein M1818_007443 [Claussenomyces sp. TS43310]|nr:MAG: hypothetical protein M1818_007443 [Claussenomyces sp. TS43310]
MLKSRRLPRGEITYSAAKDKEVNILHQLGYYDKEQQFFDRIYQKRPWIKAVVAHHLRLSSPDECHVASMQFWFHGSYNVCVPVTITSWTGKQLAQRVLLRLPLPYRVGETFRPGNGDEKIRCEAGTYAWLQENCPDVPIPRLYGFATSTGEAFTRIDNLPYLTRCFQHLRRRLLAWFGYPVPSQYVRHQGGHRLSLGRLEDAGYLLIEHIDKDRGEMLSNTWSQMRHDSKLQTNFFRDLSRIMLSISRRPLPRIGSFTIDNNGFLSLTNRPLSVGLQELENEEIPIDMPRDYTYSTVDSYLVDTLAFHDSRLRYQPNAIDDAEDCASQMSALVAMRAGFPLFFQRDLRRGPFVLNLTDLHQSNILVDKDWHITSLVDLEWACSLPVEMVGPPYWLTNQGVDTIIAEEFNTVRSQFIDILAAEEQQLGSFISSNPRKEALRLSAVMNHTWEIGTFWYTLALSSPTGLFNLFYRQIRPRLDNLDPEYTNYILIMPEYWSRDVLNTIQQKKSHKDEYDIQLKQAFRVESPY